ncbi:hypothetical protein HanXRQr2_Chr12g0551161 [Helianthus annuus]|uniref:Uncharacterized protein n=1 Tax=Helianthus annuus TaxID=4232 RepID=A0A9K3HIB6_HELAN|nr:hypothetical protein HanXRQr2_Chr12g0551161 [Helianthus annuus]KAJ0863492.1 hypothetical protein HanPSC8_Chr12g0530641 [Helianthus annuus]
MQDLDDMFEPVINPTSINFETEDPMIMNLVKIKICTSYLFNEQLFKCICWSFNY